MFLPTLRAVATSLERNLTKPSVTELLSGTRELYLKKITEYAVDPQKQLYALHGSAVHTITERHTSGNMLSEERLKNTTTTGQLDLYGQVLSNTDTTLGDLKITSSYKLMRALGYYKKDVETGEVYKTGVKKGQPKTRKELFTDGVRHVLDWALQLNYYRLLLEEENYTVSSMVIQALCRDTGLRIAIELKKDADSQTILNYLLKYTDLQVNYNFNMVAIDNFTPRQVGLQKILSSYIAHRRDIIVARSKFDKEKAEKRLHIVEGLIRVISILDEVIALIRASENKADAKENLKVSYDFSEEQAEAIVTLQLYRLTNTDIVTLQNEEADLREQIATLAAIIGDERTMFNVMKRELRDIKKKFGNDRRSELQAETKTIEIDTASLIVEEETYVSITRGGYVKRTSPRSFNASTIDEVGKRDDDDLILVQQAKTTQHLLIFTNQANVIYRPIHELPDIRWKDLGEHLSQTITNLSKDEEVLYAEILDDFETGTYLAATKLGQIKRFERKEFTPWRTYKSKSVKYAKLKDDSDFIVTVTPIQLDDIMIITQKGYALRFNADEVPVVGAKAAGVKAINLKDDDTVQAVFVANTQSFYLLTQRASLKRVATADIPQAKRAGRGLQVLRELKTKPHRVFTAGPVFTENAGGEIDLLATPVEETPQTLLVTATTGETAEVDLSLLNLSDRTSNGSFIEGLADKEVFSAKIIER